MIHFDTEDLLFKFRIKFILKKFFKVKIRAFFAISAYYHPVVYNYSFFSSFIQNEIIHLELF